MFSGGERKDTLRTNVLNSTRGKELAGEKKDPEQMVKLTLVSYDSYVSYDILCVC